MITFRPMAEEDLPQVLENELRAYTYPWTRGNFVDCLKERKDCQVAELDGRIVGHGVLGVGAGEAHILNVCIARDRQGSGFGRALLLHMLERARQSGAEVIFLEVRPSNRVAIELYESVGFNAIGVRRNYYLAPLGHEDAQIMALDMRSEFRTGTV